MSKIEGAAGGVVELSGGDVVIAMAAHYGIREVFGLAGGKLGPIYKALSEEPRLRYLGVRHEASGGFMAAGAAACTGRIALCLAETAPGGLNLASGLGVALANSLPVLAITSDHVRALSHPSRGAFSSGDNGAVFGPVTKWTGRVTDPERLPELMRMALRHALTGRPGPVHLDIPTDVLAARSVYRLVDLNAPLESFAAAGRSEAALSEVERALSCLLDARRPLLIAGGGVVASGATTAFRQLCDQLNALALSTQMGLGVVSSASPRFIGQGGFIGGAAAAQALEEADVVLAVGCRFSSWLWTAGAPRWRDDKDRKVIQIDIDPLSMGINTPVSIGLLGDAKAILEQLVSVLGDRSRSAGSWEEAVVDARRRYRTGLEAAPSTDEGKMHPAALAQAVGDFIGDDGLVVFDGGHTSFWSNEFTPTAAPRTRFHDPGMSHLGFGTPYALAMKHIYPHKPVLQITGDGAFGFTLQELDTARRYGLNVINIIHNNSAFGVIGFSQARQGFAFGDTLEGSDYAAIARGFGCHGERIVRLDEVRPALERAVKSGLPAVIDARTGFIPHPMMPMFGQSSSIAT